MAEKQEEYKGAARGTAYHRVMECLDYAETDTEEQLRAQLKRLLESRKMTEQEAECIRIRDIRRFVESGLGQRMKKAAMKKHLYREQPFVIQRSASMLDDGWILIRLQPKLWRAFLRTNLLRVVIKGRTS